MKLQQIWPSGNTFHKCDLYELKEKQRRKWHDTVILVDVHSALSTLYFMNTQYVLKTKQADSLVT